MNWNKISPSQAHVDCDGLRAFGAFRFLAITRQESRIMRIGDRVFHRGMGEYGTVDNISRDGISVKYDRKSEKTGENWCGLYDSNWFRLYPDGLVLTDKASPGR